MDLKEGEEANDSFDVKNSHEEVGQIFSLESKMLINSNALPIETSHTSLDIFERPQLLATLTGHLNRKLARCMLQMDQRWSLKSRETGPTLSIYKTFIWKSSVKL